VLVLKVVVVPRDVPKLVLNTVANVVVVSKLVLNTVIVLNVDT
jgi:hypothetical protein